MRATTRPKATFVTQSGTETVWLVQWPSTGKAYYATTYRGSDSLRLETASTRRVVADGVAKKITATARRAIDFARVDVGWQKIFEAAESARQ